MPTFFDTAKVIAIFSCLIPLIIGFRKRELLWWLALASFISDLSSLILLQNKVYQYTYLISTLYMYIDIVLVTTYFYKNGVLGIKNNYIVILLALLVSATLINLSTVKFQKFDTKGLAVVLIVYIIFSLIGYAEILRKRSDIPLGKQPFFWGNTAIFIFACNTFFIFLMSESGYRSDKVSFLIIWMVGILLTNTIKNILIAISLAKSNHE